MLTRKATVPATQQACLPNAHAEFQWGRDMVGSKQTESRRPLEPHGKKGSHPALVDLWAPATADSGDPYDPHSHSEQLVNHSWLGDLEQSLDVPEHDFPQPRT